MPGDKIRVVVIDDHPGVRAGLKKLLRRANDIVIVGEAGDGAKAIELASAKKPDILLLDVELPVLGGDIVMRRIHDSEPAIRVLIVSTYNDRTYVQSMLSNGAAGYLTKDEAPAMLLDAIHQVLASEDLWLSPRALETTGGAASEEQTLTNREADILRLLVLNHSPEEIGDSLHMEEKRVTAYLGVLMDKFEARSLDELKTVARRVLPWHESQHKDTGNSQIFVL